MTSNNRIRPYYPSLLSPMMGGPAIAQAFENAFLEDGDLKFGFDSFTVGEVKRLFEAKERLEFSEYKLRKLTVTATEMAMGEAASAGAGYGLGALARALRRAGAGARAWNPVTEMVKRSRGLSSYTDDAANASNGMIRWNNGWQTPNGRFARPQGAGRAGAAAEQEAWDAIAAKPGWSVRTGRISVRDSAGQLRVYDGAAISPGNRHLGLEIKSGTGRLTRAQGPFDSALNSSGASALHGLGANSDLWIRRSLEIHR